MLTGRRISQFDICDTVRSACEQQLAVGPLSQPVEHEVGIVISKDRRSVEVPSGAKRVRTDLPQKRDETELFLVEEKSKGSCWLWGRIALGFRGKRRGTSYLAALDLQTI